MLNNKYFRQINGNFLDFQKQFIKKYTVLVKCQVLYNRPIKQYQTEWAKKRRERESKTKMNSDPKKND